MKKIFLLSFFIFYLLPAKASQWFVGVPVNDSILSGSMNGYNNCFPQSENSLIYPVSNVTGVKYALIVRTITVSNSIYTTQAGILNVGDSLFFTSTFPIYDFFYPTASSFSYVIRAVGTPQVASEHYPCGSFFETCTTISCQYACSYNFFTQCTVQVVSGASEAERKIEMSIYPNPTSFAFTINSTEKISSIEIFDVLGNLIQKETTDSKQPTTINLIAPKGIYFVKVIDEKGYFSVKKIIVE